MHVDYCIDDNGEAHHTSRYELMNRGANQARLVVRRGQAFHLDINLSRNYDPAIDGMSIVFTLDGIKRPIYGHNTLIASPVLHPGEVSDGAWQTVVEAYAENSLRIKVWCFFFKCGVNPFQRKVQDEDQLNLLLLKVVNFFVEERFLM